MTEPQERGSLPQKSRIYLEFAEWEERGNPGGGATLNNQIGKCEKFNCSSQNWTKWGRTNRINKTDEEGWLGFQANPTILTQPLFPWFRHDLLQRIAPVFSDSYFGWQLTIFVQPRSIQPEHHGYGHFMSFDEMATKQDHLLCGCGLWRAKLIDLL